MTSLLSSTEFEEFDSEAPVSKFVGAFTDPSLKDIVVREHGEFEGVITRQQLTAPRHPPEEKLGSIV